MYIFLTAMCIFLTIWSILCLLSILLMCLRYDYKELADDFFAMFVGLKPINAIFLAILVYLSLPFNIGHSIIQIIKQKNK